ncbi:MAG: PilZ domain-containing protein [Acidobacteria bacterium]|nr:PilZ domain-containing protein [Acidobacteriota bacterium]
MNDAQTHDTTQGHERRKYPRYFVSGRMTLAIEDESIGESIGIGEASDLSLGGVRVQHLPLHKNVRPGDRLGLLLMNEAEALMLHGEVVHHGTTDSFGVEFRNLSQTDGRRINELIQTLNH